MAGKYTVKKRDIVTRLIVREIIINDGVYSSEATNINDNELEVFVGMTHVAVSNKTAQDLLANKQQFEYAPKESQYLMFGIPCEFIKCTAAKTFPRQQQTTFLSNNLKRLSVRAGSVRISKTYSSYSFGII